MGLSIYYKGRFGSKASLQEMIAEVKDTAEIYKWEYHIFETEFNPAELQKKNTNQSIYGIIFSPPGSEPVQLTYLSNGRMSSPFIQEHIEGTDDDEKLRYNLFTKTQFAGFEVHRIIIDFLKYLNKKYFQEFELIDESQYWETGDENVLRQNFKRYNDLMDQFASGLENIKLNENESIDDFIIRVAKNMKPGEN